MTTLLAPPVAVLAAYRFEQGTVERLPAGRVNEHWRATRGSVAFVLRRYAAGQSASGIRWEHALLRHFESAGWPVATPVTAEGGRTIVEVEGASFALFPVLGGTPIAPPAAAGLVQKGRLLAEVHRTGASFALGQRPDLGRAWELDALASRADGMTFNQLLARFAAGYPEVGRAIRAHRYRNLRELARLGYGELPDVVAHCDFHGENLLFEDGRLTGLLDFDWAHRDAAIYDIAVSVSLDCLAPPVYDHVSPESAAAFVRGYGEVTPLPDDQLAMLPALVRSSWLWLATFRMVQWHNGWLPAERAAASLARTAQRRLPALDAGAATLLRAVRQTTTPA